MVKIVEAGTILELNRIFLCNGHRSTLDDLNNETMPHPFVAKELFGEKKKTFFLLPTR